MRGIEIGTHVEGEEISSPRLDPFWAEVERLGAVVVIHTQGTTHATASRATTSSTSSVTRSRRRWRRRT